MNGDLTLKINCVDQWRIYCFSLILSDVKHVFGSKQSHVSFRRSLTKALFGKQCNRYHLIDTHLAPRYSIPSWESVGWHANGTETVCLTRLLSSEMQGGRISSEEVAFWCVNSHWNPALLSNHSILSGSFFLETSSILLEIASWRFACILLVFFRSTCYTSP